MGCGRSSIKTDSRSAVVELNRNVEQVPENQSHTEVSQTVNQEKQQQPYVGQPELHNNSVHPQNNMAPITHAQEVHQQPVFVERPQQQHIEEVDEDEAMFKKQMLNKNEANKGQSQPKNLDSQPFTLDFPAGGGPEFKTREHVIEYTINKEEEKPKRPKVYPNTENHNQRKVKDIINNPDAHEDDMHSPDLEFKKVHHDEGDFDVINSNQVPKNVQQKRL